MLEFRLIEELVLERTGLWFPERRAYFFSLRVRRLMGERGLSDPVKYLKLLERDEGEFQKLVNSLLVAETYFMREFNGLLAGVRWVVERGRPARVLSAGCSTGEELYSALMLFEDYNFGEVIGVGVDLNTDSLEIARRGVYGPGSVRWVEPEAERVMKKYLIFNGDKVSVPEPLRGKARFYHGNLLKGVPGKYDLIFLRNVLYYIHPDYRKKILENLREALAGGGLVVPGVVDALSGPEGVFKEETLGGITVWVPG